MFPTISPVIGQGWERHEFRFRVVVLRSTSLWKISAATPHPRNRDLIARWRVEPEAYVNRHNFLELKLSTRVLCPERKSTFGTVYVHFQNYEGRVLYGMRQKWCFQVEREKIFTFTCRQWIPRETTMLITFVSETGQKPGFTDILLLDVKMALARLPREEEYSTRTTRYRNGNGSHSRDASDTPGNNGPKLWIGKWEKFKFIFHSFKPRNDSEIQPREVIGDDSVQRWRVKLSSEMDVRDTFHFLVTVELLPNAKHLIFAKVMYVVERKGSVTQKHEFSYFLNVDRSTTHILRNVRDIKNTVIKVSIISDTGVHLRQLYLPNTCDGSIEIETSDRPCVKQENRDVGEHTASQEVFRSHDLVPVKTEPSDHVQPVVTHRVDDSVQVDKDVEPPKKQKSKHKADLQITSGDLNGDVAGPSHRNNDDDQSLQSRVSDNTQVSSVIRQDKPSKTTELPDVPPPPETDVPVEFGCLDKWKRTDHLYSFPDLEQFLYLYTVKIIEGSSSIQQQLCCKSRPRESSSSWNVKVESWLCSNNKGNMRITATLEKSKINLLFARIFIFVYPATDQTEYACEKKKCLCVGDCITEDIQDIMSAATKILQILILSENPDSLLSRYCDHDAEDECSLQNSKLVRVRSSTDFLEVDSSALSNSSPILRAIIQNLGFQKKRRFICMTQFSAKVVRSALDFIGGATEIDWGRRKTEQVFILSDKYCISDLKEKCELHLVTLLNLKNALKLLVFAVDNSAEQLKKVTLELVSRNNKFFQKNDGYDTLHDRPEIMEWMLEYLRSDRESDKKRKRDDDSSMKKKKKKHQ